MVWGPETAVDVNLGVSVSVDLRIELGAIVLQAQEGLEGLWEVVSGVRRFLAQLPCLLPSIKNPLKPTRSPLCGHLDGSHGPLNPT